MKSVLPPKNLFICYQQSVSSNLFFGPKNEKKKIIDDSIGTNSWILHSIAVVVALQHKCGQRAYDGA